MVSTFIKPPGAQPAMSYANYRQLADLVLVPPAEQITNTNWSWLPPESKASEIDRLQNLVEARDVPQSGGEATW